MKPVLTVSIVLPISQQQAFAFITDWERQQSWIPATRITKKQHDDRAGGSVIARTSLLGIGFNDRMSITTYDAPHNCAVRHTGKLVRGQGQFIVESVGAQSRFTWLEDVSQTAWWYRYLFILSKPISIFFLKLSLYRLRRVIVSLSKTQ